MLMMDDRVTSKISQLNFRNKRVEIRMNRHIRERESIERTETTHAQHRIRERDIQTVKSRTSRYIFHVYSLSLSFDASSSYSRLILPMLLRHSLFSF